MHGISAMATEGKRFDRQDTDAASLRMELTAIINEPTLEFLLVPIRDTILAEFTKVLMKNNDLEYERLCNSMAKVQRMFSYPILRR